MRALSFFCALRACCFLLLAVLCSKALPLETSFLAAKALSSNALAKFLHYTVRMACCCSYMSVCVVVVLLVVVMVVAAATRVSASAVSTAGAIQLEVGRHIFASSACVFMCEIRKYAGDQVLACVIFASFACVCVCEILHFVASAVSCVREIF